MPRTVTVPYSTVHVTRHSHAVSRACCRPRIRRADPGRSRMPLRAGSTWAAASTRFALGRSESLAMWLAALRAAIQEQIGLPPASACTRGGRARTATSNRPATAPGPLRTAAAPSGSSLEHTLRRAVTTREIPVQRHRTRARRREADAPTRSFRLCAVCGLFVLYQLFARTSETARIVTSVV